MQKKYIPENIKPLENDIVRLKEMGNVIEVMYCDNVNRNITILKLSDDLYVDLRTGEVKECNHIENRADNTNSVRISLGKLRDIINTNVTDYSKCLWATLTYAENMTDHKRLYTDVKKFIMRLHYHYGQFEYIIVPEPQGRGAWHCHCILIFNHRKPFIPNAELAKIWGFGFTKVTALDNNACDNLGAYLTAYLSDLSFDELCEYSVCKMDLTKGKGVKTIETTDENGNKVEKKIIKGGRLWLYPPKMNLYRCSKGIKRPEAVYVTEKEAEKKVSDATLTFERTVSLSDEETGFVKTINYRQFNTKRKKNQ